MRASVKEKCITVAAMSVWIRKDSLHTRCHHGVPAEVGLLNIILEICSTVTVKLPTEVTSFPTDALFPGLIKLFHERFCCYH